jgi:hypothetical protein
MFRPTLVCCTALALPPSRPQEHNFSDPCDAHHSFHTNVRAKSLKV